MIKCRDRGPGVETSERMRKSGEVCEMTAQSGNGARVEWPAAVPRGVERRSGTRRQ